MENKKPKHFLVLKILGFLLFAVGVTLTVLGATVLSWEHSPNPALLAPGLLLVGSSLTMLFFGFSPEFTKCTQKQLSIYRKKIRPF